MLAEELGWVGVAALLSLCSIAALRALNTAKLAAIAGMTYQAFVAASFGLWLGIQTCVNIGVNMGLLPTKGLTLPFLSYGGSSMVVTLGWLGLVLRIHHEAGAQGKSAVIKERRA